jgi:hypothetical protein
MSETNVARYLRLSDLILPLQFRMDNGELDLRPAVELSFLTADEQGVVEKIMAENGFRMDMRKASLLRDFSKQGKLDEDKIYLIFSGELARPVTKKNRVPMVKIGRAVFQRHFDPELSAKEIQGQVEYALDFFKEVSASLYFQKYLQLGQPPDEIAKHVGRAMDMYFVSVSLAQNQPKKNLVENQEAFDEPEV